MTDDDDKVLEARASGRSVERIAREFGTSVESINRTLDEYSIELLSEKNLKRSLMLELVRLDRLVETFYAKALAGDVNAGTLLTRVSIRRSCLLGLDPVQGFAVTVINQPPQHQSNSTTRIRDVLTTLLEHREAVTAEEHDELAELGSADQSTH